MAINQITCQSCNNNVAGTQAAVGASRMECIEVQKVFDQCLIRRCLVFGPTETATTDPELRRVLEGLGANDVQRFIGCRNFNLVINSVT
jgi:rRNA-processing protein FCF1